MGRCRFNSSWLSREDGQGHLLSEWGAASSDNLAVICKICDGLPSINIQGAGFQALKQHANTTAHKANVKVKLNPAQLRLSKSPATATKTTNEGSGAQAETIRLYSVRDATTTAELIWCMLGVANNWSFASNQHVPDCFRAMFDCPVAHSFTMSPTKTMYLITEALGPCFEEQQKKDMEGTYYSLSYDETCNSGGHKELQTNVRYWSDRSGKVVCSHLRTSFIGKATAKIVYSNLRKAMDKGALSISNLVMASSDGPNVNKSVLNMINEDCKKDERKIPLLDVAFCNIHVVHNAFDKGLCEFGRDVSDLVFDVNRYFKSFPSRWEEFDDLHHELNPLDSTQPTPHFIKHCPSRWLTLGPAAKRLLLLWGTTEKYFLDFISKQKTSKNVMESKSYLRIRSALQSKTMKAQLLFVISSADAFEHFLKLFQKEEPLMHVLHEELVRLLKTLIGRACKSVTPSLSDFRSDNFLPVESVAMGDGTMDALKKVSEKEVKVFVNSVRKHYEACCRHLLKKASVSPDSVLASFRCLSPLERRSERSICDIARLAAQLPFEVSKDRLIDEWKLLQQEPVDDNEGEDGRTPIDLYWKQFFEKKHPGGGLRYPLVTKVVKALLTVYHGNADVERGFSTSQRVLTEDIECTIDCEKRTSRLPKSPSPRSHLKRIAEHGAMRTPKLR